MFERAPFHSRLLITFRPAQIRNAYYDDIILEDLTASTTQDRIILETQNKKNATSAVASKSSGSNSADGELGLDEDQMEEVLQITRAAFAEWTPNLGSVSSFVSFRSLAYANLPVLRHSSP